MRALVCGGRDYLDGAAAFASLDQLDAGRTITLVIEGGQRTRDPITREIIGGADWWAKQWAVARGKECKTVCADWGRHNRAAGPIRNQQMIDECKPDVVIAFQGGRGTEDMVRRASKAGIPVRKVSG